MISHFMYYCIDKYTCLYIKLIMIDSVEKKSASVHAFDSLLQSSTLLSKLLIMKTSLDVSA